MQGSQLVIQTEPEAPQRLPHEYPPHNDPPHNDPPHNDRPQDHPPHEQPRPLPRVSSLPPDRKLSADERFRGLMDAFCDDASTSQLTLNWRRQRPQPMAFGLQSAVPPVPVSGLGGGAALVLQLCAFAALGIGMAMPYWLNPMSPEGAKLGVGVGLGLALLLGAAAGLLSHRSHRNQRSLRGWTGYQRALSAYVHVQAWKETRTEVSFWQTLGEAGDGASFERECAELLAAILQTDDVVLTASPNDYGADVLVDGATNTAIAQCKLRRNTPPTIGQIRELAGSKAFFGADQGFLFSLTKVSDQRVQASDFAQTCDLQYWDLEAIVALARYLAFGPNSESRNA